jgi:hypothetical protein
VGPPSIPGPDEPQPDLPGTGELPLRSRDEEAVGWGDERDEPDADDDVARLLADRPPHHDRD